MYSGDPMSKSLNLSLNNKRALLVELGEAEVSDLRSAVMQKYIGSLEVPVGHSHLPQIPQPLVHIEYQLSQFCLRKRPLLSFDPLLQIPLVAKLSDNIAISIGEERFIELDDIGVTHLLQDADLLEDELLEVLGLERVERDDLDRHYFFYFRKERRVTVLYPRYTRAKFPLPISSQ